MDAILSLSLHFNSIELLDHFRTGVFYMSKSILKWMKKRIFLPATNLFHLTDILSGSYSVCYDVCMDLI